MRNIKLSSILAKLEKEEAKKVIDYLKLAGIIPQDTDENKMGTTGSIASNILKDIKDLSSGTVSTLTGLTQYQDIDKFKKAFINYSENSDILFKSWQDAFKQMMKDYKIALTNGKVKKEDILNKLFGISAKITSELDVSKVIDDLIKTEWSKSKEETGKAINLLKGLAFSDNFKAKKFMKAIDDFTTGMNPKDYI